MKSNSNHTEIFGAGMTLEFTAEALKNLEGSVEIGFELKQLQNIGEMLLTQSELSISQFVNLAGFKQEVITILDKNEFIDQKPNIENFF